MLPPRVRMRLSVDGGRREGHSQLARFICASPSYGGNVRISSMLPVRYVFYFENQPYKRLQRFADGVYFFW